MLSLCLDFFEKMFKLFSIVSGNIIFTKPPQLRWSGKFVSPVISLTL